MKEGREVKHWRQGFGFRVVPVHPGLVTSDYGVHELWGHYLWSPACPVEVAFALLQSFRHFPCNGNLQVTH